MNFFVFVRVEMLEEFLEWGKDITQEPSQQLKHKVRICFPHHFTGFTMLGVDRDTYQAVLDKFNEPLKC